MLSLGVDFGKKMTEFANLGNFDSKKLVCFFSTLEFLVHIRFDVKMREMCYESFARIQAQVENLEK